MLYDDDRGGSPYEPLDNRQWGPPRADHELLKRLSGPARVLVLLGGHAAGYAFRDDLVFEATGGAWRRWRFDAVIGRLAGSGLVVIEEESGRRWLTITAAGNQRARSLVDRARNS
ncbi:hypothetical protein AB0C07_21195 [Actinoplanes missouriensis]|uniref:hypothetical protein n=1 Tax=Actinoplanes missouriensis TaxID=1866 RepID=UPI0033EBAE36